MFSQKYLAKGSKSPSPGSEKSPCKYSSRGAKSQPRFSHYADQGKITKQVLLQEKFVVIQKVKGRDNECGKKKLIIQEGKKDYGEESAEETKETIQGNDEFDGEDEEFEAAHAEEITFNRAST